MFYVKPGETLKDFYKRTNLYWQMAAHEHTQHTGKVCLFFSLNSSFIYGSVLLLEFINQLHALLCILLLLYQSLTYLDRCFLNCFSPGCDLK